MIDPIQAKRFYTALTQYKSLCLALLVCIFIVPLGYLGKIEFSLDYRAFFGGNDPHVLEFFKQQETFQKSDNILIAVKPSNGRYVFDADLLQKLKKYTEAAWKIPYVTRVDSMTNFQNSFSQGEDDVVIQDLVPSESVGFSIDQVRKIAMTEPALLNRLVSKNGKITGINITISLPDDHPEGAVFSAVEAARTLANQLESEPEVADVYLSGTVMINNAFYEVSLSDIKSFIPAMFVVIVLALILQLKSVPASLFIFFVVGLSVAVTFGFGGLLDIEITPPSAAAAPIVMMLSIAGSVHLIAAYYRNIRSGVSQSDAMLKSFNDSFTPIFLTWITTIVGFLTLNFSESPPFRDMGNLVAIGSTAAFLLTMTLVPIVIPLIRVPSSPGLPLLDSVLLGISGLVVKHTRSVLVVSCLAIAILFTTIGKNELNDEFLKYFDESIEFRKDNDFISENLTGVYQIEYSIDSGADNGISNPEYLALLDRFAKWYRTQPDVIHVQTISDIYKKANMNLHSDRPEEYRVPESQELAAQAIFAYEMSLPFGLDLNNQLSIDKSASKFVATVKTISAKDLIELERLADKWLKEHAPIHAQALGTGPALLFAHIGQRSIYSGLINGALALVIVCALISLLFRSLKLGLISLVPNIFPAAMAFGVWGMFYGQINMALATVISMTLGIIVDDTIHFMHRFKLSLQSGASAEQAVQATFEKSGQAIVITSVVLIAGFLVLALSPFAMNWGMGILSSITIAFALMTDLILLPAVLLVIYGRKNEVLAADTNLA